ncbi:YciI-like protein [Aureimonas ureilytica]|uniref:YciI-like protein n=1 Tax=Aureimonas ureilytica TaxID=401562 RepID=UPI00035D9F07|nr:YciI-like protein [Aureimonas ureilytica]
MLFALLCEDRADAGSLRAETRPAHLEHLKALGSTLRFAGPFLGADEKPNGSLLVVEAESLEAARALADADPYAKAGLFASVTVRRWNWTVNNPEEA